jgi:hypothetical protein
MYLLIRIFGEDKDLDILQMTSWGIVAFFICLILIRIAGRRTFGMRTAFDNIITIMLGAILNQAVVGASPFLPIIICSSGIVILHRLFTRLGVTRHFFDTVIKGDKVKEDVQQALRLEDQLNSLEQVHDIYGKQRKNWHCFK